MTSFLIQIATFDPVPEEWIKSVFTLPDHDPYDEQFESCSYGGIHSFENLGMTCVLLHAYFLMSFFLLLFIILRKDFRINTTVTKLQTYLFFAWPVRCFYEGFLEITIAVSIHYTNMIWTDVTLGILYCNVATFALTLVLLYLMIQIVVYYFKIKDLDEDKFRDRYGALYDGLKISHLCKEPHDEGILYYLQWQEEIMEGTEIRKEVANVARNVKLRKTALVFPTFFMLRRFVFVWVAMNLKEWPLLQILVSMLTSIGATYYLTHFSPFESSLETRIEVMNETTSLLLLDSMIGFTDLLGDP